MHVKICFFVDILSRRTSCFRHKLHDRNMEHCNHIVGCAMPAGYSVASGENWYLFVLNQILFQLQIQISLWHLKFGSDEMHPLNGMFIFQEFRQLQFHNFVRILLFLSHLFLAQFDITVQPICEFGSNLLLYCGPTTMTTLTNTMSDKKSSKEIIQKLEFCQNDSPCNNKAVKKFYFQIFDQNIPLGPTKTHARL